MLAPRLPVLPPYVLPAQAGVLPYGEAIVCIATTLVALCLNTGGLERVRSSRVIDAFVPILISKK